MADKRFTKIRPKFDNCISKEPNLRDMIFYWYKSSGMQRKDALRYTREYIKQFAWLEDDLLD